MGWLKNNPSAPNKLQSSGAIFILFGGKHCNVCQSIHPQLSLMLKQQFPNMRGVYVDCEKSPNICAQHNVFTLPVVKAYIDGKNRRTSTCFQHKSVSSDHRAALLNVEKINVDLN